MAEVAKGATDMDRPEVVLVGLGPIGPELASDPRAPFLRADDLGVLRGDGVFERFLVVSGRPRHFREHLERLARSAKAVDLALPGPEAWEEAVAAAIAAWGGSAEWEARLVCTRGPEEGGPPTAYVLGQELSPALLRQRREGLSAVTLERGLAEGLAAEAPWLLLGAKTLSYAVNVAAKRWAEANGAEDAIFVGPGGTVLEAVTSSVVALVGGRLVSPPESLGILGSISVASLFEEASRAGFDVVRGPLSIEDLFAAEGVWLSSSLRFARVHTLDGKALPPAPRHGELTRLAAL
jgi:4-amino-4-deoxychorismate lyase